MDQYAKIESIGSIGSIILAILEVQVHTYICIYIYVYTGFHFKHLQNWLLVGRSTSCPSDVASETSAEPSPSAARAPAGRSWLRPLWSTGFPMNPEESPKFPLKSSFFKGDIGPC